MIELTFGESAAGGLQLAVSMKNGEKLNGPTAFIGGARDMPREWTGESVAASSRDVYPLSLMLDAGDLSDVSAGRPAIRALFGRYPGVTEELAGQNAKTLNRLQAARNANESVRAWASAVDPCEVCGLCYLCFLFRDSASRLFIASPEPEFASVGEVPAERLGEFANAAREMDEAEISARADKWEKLVRERAPLRAVVNGGLMSVNEDFYDPFIRARVPDGEFREGVLIGRVLTNVKGVGDAWLHNRIEKMLARGELETVSPATEEHPYSAVMKSAFAQSR